MNTTPPPLTLDMLAKEKRRTAGRTSVEYG